MVKVDLFKSPSEKIHELHNENTPVRVQLNSRLGKGSFGLPRFAQQFSLTFGLRCARIDILSLTRVFFQTAT